MNPPGKYPASRVKWSGGRPLECLVFNSDFASRNFASHMAGIFTLGVSEAGLLQQIADEKLKFDQLNQEISTLRNTLGPDDSSAGKRKELQDLRAQVEATCWESKVAHDAHFQGAFTGVLKSKTKFCDRMLNEYENNAAQLSTLEELKARALTIFQNRLERHANYAQIDGSDLVSLENEPVLGKKVIGKADLDIGRLIDRLSNSDWVRQGREYLKAEPEKCPFCQQAIDDQFRKNIEEYFDEIYLSDISDIDRIIKFYDEYAKHLLLKIDGIIATESRHLDKEALQNARDRLASCISANKDLLKKKKAEASVPVVLGSIGEPLAVVVELIASANQSINTHNAMVDNISQERSIIVEQIWKYITHEKKVALSDHQTKKGNLGKAIENISEKISKKLKEQSELEKLLSDLERKITSVIPVVREINTILNSFGFKNFKLATAGDRQHLYTIIRADGSDAVATLSEGEKTFVIFLYFYHLIKGSINASGLTNDRVIIFDDPVSSLDSDVLFIVSTLIRKIIGEIRNNSGYVRQIFVLTHNIYFHKEISFDAERGGVCRKYETFWIVKKVGMKSEISNYAYNPIKTSYELLWDEVKNYNSRSSTIQNTLRRILENYFKLLGNLNADKITSKFEGREQQICGSLFSWVNDGSHSIYDDLYISSDETSTAIYIDVFKKIFKMTDHYSHFRMMMGDTAMAKIDQEEEIAADFGANDEATAA